MTPERRAALLRTLEEHVAHKRQSIGTLPPSPAGCIVLLALEIDCACLALGPCEIPGAGIVVRHVGGPR